MKRPDPMPPADVLARFPIGMIPQRRTSGGTPPPALPDFKDLVAAARRVYFARRWAPRHDDGGEL